MKDKSKLVLVVLTLIACGWPSAYSQPREPQASQQPPQSTNSNPNAASAPQRPSPPPANGQKATHATALLSEGTDVNLAIDQDLSSKTAQEGDPVEFVLTEDIRVGDLVVVRAGARGVGEVTNAEKREWFSEDKPELSIRPDYLKVGSFKIRLRGTYGVAKGRKDVKIKKGQRVTVHVAQDIYLPAA